MIWTDFKIIQPGYSCCPTFKWPSFFVFFLKDKEFYLKDKIAPGKEVK